MDKQISQITLRAIMAYYKSLTVLGRMPYSEVNRMLALLALNEMVCCFDECTRRRIYNIMTSMIGKSCLMPFPGTGDECLTPGLNPRITEDRDERITEDESFWKQINNES